MNLTLESRNTGARLRLGLRLQSGPTYSSRSGSGVVAKDYSKWLKGSADDEAK